MKIKKYILGIDEAGRGSLAGPVYVAATLFPENYLDENIKDSKLLSPKLRDKAYSIIKKEAIWHHFYSLSNLVIDSIGISKAIYILMRQLYYDAKLFFPELNILTIVDGNFNPIKENDSICMIKADRKIFSVSAASIIAKVERDRFMNSLSKIYSNYSFDSHKGYGTKKHINEILNFGATIIHRKSFIISDKAKKYALD